MTAGWLETEAEGRLQECSQKIADINAGYEYVIQG
jgi:hypothetical protein